MAETAIDHIDNNLRVINNNIRLVNEHMALVNDNLLHVNEKVDTIDGEITDLHQKQNVLIVELGKLSKEFKDYVGEYRRKTELQLAETQIVKIRQQLETNFGYYAEIRRMATGILQGVDSRLVSNDTLQYATEEVMIKAPGYWLAPTLVCLASWLRNDRQTAERAVRESIRRDDYKTSLFFCLLTRRINRTDAVLKWIERYFQHQNPHGLDREFIIILESVSTGVFPPATREIMTKHVKDWVQELSQTDDFINQQKDNWIAFFKSLRDTEEQKQYAILTQFATNWENLEESLQLAKAYQPIFAHFNAVISSGSGLSSSLIKQLDSLLDSLVTNFDDEELPLRKKERECELVIEKNGDRDAALAIMATEEKIFSEKVDFLQMLTNAAFNPKESGVTAATQALALSISQPWILEGFNTFVAQNRSVKPTQIQFDIDGWQESTIEGREEKELLYKQNVYYENLKDEYIAQAKFPVNKLVYPSLLILLAIIGLFSENYWLLVALAGGGYWIYTIWKAHDNYKNSIDAQVEQRKQQAATVLRGLLADVVEYEGEYKIEDAESNKVISFIENINSDQFMSLSKGVARSILK